MRVLGFTDSLLAVYLTDSSIMACSYTLKAESCSSGYHSAELDFSVAYSTGIWCHSTKIRFHKGLHYTLVKILSKVQEDMRYTQLLADDLGIVDFVIITGS